MHGARAWGCKHALACLPACPPPHLPAPLTDHLDAVPLQLLYGHAAPVTMAPFVRRALASCRWDLQTSRAQTTSG